MSFPSGPDKEKRWDSKILRRLQEIERSHEKDSYPLPRRDNIVEQLSGNSWFSTLDLKSRSKFAQRIERRWLFLLAEGFGNSRCDVVWVV